jgi:CO/xanthine dehydrogenase Mo-binding subunit
MKTFICLTLLIANSSLVAADSWPQFRGPNAGGVADDERPPVHFGPETNLHWKVDVPPGVSSPVVSKEYVFLTAFQDGQLLTIAYNTEAGRELWRRAAPAKEIERCHQFSSPAAPTPCTDGERIYVYFGSFGLLAYDFAGNEVWQRPFERLPIEYGTASSPVLAGGKLILQRDGNVANRARIIVGDVERGFEEADRVFEHRFRTAMVHQGYIEPHNAVGQVNPDGQAIVWCSTQGPFEVRHFCAEILALPLSKIRVVPTEIGGGFGGKTVVYLEPLALALSRKAKRPVKMVMSREEVFKASGPTSGAVVKVKMGATKDGKFVAGFAELKYQAGAFQGSPVQPGTMCAYAPYDIEHVHVIGYDVVSNRPKVAAYRAPGAPISEYAVESVVDEIAKKLDIDPIDLRMQNAAHEGTKAAYGPKFGPIGLEETLNAIKKTEHWNAPLRKWQGRGVASGFWFNIGGETSVSLTVNEDGTVSLMAGTPDIGGLRASLAAVAADELGVPYDKVRPIIGDTGSLGFNFLTGGSRSAFSGSMAIVEAAKNIKADLCARACKLWEAKPDQVEFSEGAVRPLGALAEKVKPMSVADFAKISGKTGGPIGGLGRINAQGAGPSFGTHLVDLEVDPETGRTTILRYTVAQDAGRALHPAYVEGQFQGGAVQGIGWALNEEYVYGTDGKLQNAGFLDYRMPVASDVPMIDAILVEVGNPKHPYGVRGVGETPIVPPLGAIANAMENATGIRFTELPMSPPKVLKALKDKGLNKA